MLGGGCCLRLYIVYHVWNMSTSTKTWHHGLIGTKRQPHKEQAQVGQLLSFSFAYLAVVALSCSSTPVCRVSVYRIPLLEKPVARLEKSQCFPTPFDVVRQEAETSATSLGWPEP